MARGNSILGACMGIQDDSNGNGEHLIDGNTIVLKNRSGGAGSIYGIEMWSSNRGANRIINNTIIGSAAVSQDWGGIRVDNDYNRIFNNDLYDAGGAGTTIGIHQNNALDNNIIKHNLVSGFDTNIVEDGSGTTAENILL